MRRLTHLISAVLLLALAAYSQTAVVRQAGATRGAFLGTIAGDPTAPENGDTWYNSTTGKFRGRENGSNVDLRSAGGSSVDPYDTLSLVDEFFGRGTTSGSAGILGWSWTGGAVSVPALGTPYATIWGMVRRDTAATASSFATMYLLSVGQTQFPSSGSWTITYRVKAGSTWDANTVAQVGMSCSSNLTTDPAYAIYFRLSGATTANWFTVTRQNSTETANDTGIAIGTDWNKIVIRRVDASTIGFKIGSAAETTHTTNIPVQQCNPWLSITNGSTAAVASLDLEFFSLSATSGR